MKTIALENDRRINLFNDKYVWILLIISLVVRIYLSLFTYVIENDSVAFMQNAKFFADGDFQSGLRHDYHPLYSFFITVIFKIIPDMEISGTIVSVFFGTLTVIVFYLIGKRVFDSKAAIVSSIILAFHPYAVRFSADIISESTYFFFFISAFGLGFFAITNKKYFLFALTGICSALAYLTRPEGIGIVLIVAGWCILKDITGFRSVWKEKIISILILIVSFLVFSMPYLVYIKKETGDWRLTKKKNVSHVAGIDAVLTSQNNSKLAKGSDSDVIKKTTAGKLSLRIRVNGMKHVLSKYLSTFHFLLFLFLIIGVINWKRVKKRRYFGFYITTVIVFYLYILYRLCITYMANHGEIYQYPSRRHLMPLVIPAIFCVGIGVHAVGAWVHNRFQVKISKSRVGVILRGTWSIQIVIMIIVVSIMLPKTLKPQRCDKSGIKVVGQWIKEHSGKPFPAILSVSARNAYYAGGKHVQMENLSDSIALARKQKADYLWITQEDYTEIEREVMESVENKKIVLVYKYPEDSSLNDSKMFLYKMLY